MLTTFFEKKVQKKSTYLYCEFVREEYTFDLFIASGQYRLPKDFLPFSSIETRASLCVVNEMSLCGLLLVPSSEPAGAAVAVGVTSTTGGGRSGSSGGGSTPLEIKQNKMYV